MEFTPELKQILTPGNAVKLWYSEDNPNNEIRHIRAIVDDDYIVYRVWITTKKRWNYQVAPWSSFYYPWKDGDLKPCKPR